MLTEHLNTSYLEDTEDDAWPGALGASLLGTWDSSNLNRPFPLVHRAVESIENNGMK
jgi:hypothetical protein